MYSRALVALLPLLAGLGNATPLPIGKVAKREVPQEQSHDKFLRTTQQFLQLDNPDNIQDPVFGLLGNAAAADGAGAITNLDCLQQETADRAFTNAKAQNDVDGMTAALVYRALERNTARVGQASVICNEAAVNPEIAPRSGLYWSCRDQQGNHPCFGAADIGGDPLVALESGTFTPGDVNDPTGKGNTCDDPDCIFDQGRLVEDASEAEINVAVQGIVPRQNNNAGDGQDDGGECPVEEEEAAEEEVAGNQGGGAAKGIDVGQCTEFSMTFAGGLQGRGADEFAFQPTDLANFNQGNALNPDIIARFMCDTFVNACARSATTRDVCKEVQTGLLAQLESGALQRDQGYADAWLAGLENAFGISSSGTGTANTGGVVEATPVEEAAPVPTNNNGQGGGQVNIQTAPNPAQTGAATGGNVQTFAGALNGAAAPAVIEGSGARLNADTFVNKAAALQRSCAVQHNACANAFNSGDGNGSVAACDAQEAECNAAASA